MRKALQQLVAGQLAHFRAELLAELLQAVAAEGLAGGGSAADPLPPPAATGHMTWLCLKRFLILSLARGVPGEGPDCHVPQEIIGFEPIPARIRKFVIFIVALSTARLYARPGPSIRTPGCPPDRT